MHGKGWVSNLDDGTMGVARMPFGWLVWKIWEEECADKIWYPIESPVIGRKNAWMDRGGILCSAATAGVMGGQITNIRAWLSFVNYARDTQISSKMADWKHQGGC